MVGLKVTGYLPLHKLLFSGTIGKRKGFVSAPESVGQKPLHVFSEVHKDI